LVVRPPDDLGPAVLVVDLPDAPLDALTDRADATLTVLDSVGEADWETRERNRHAVFNILDWSWQAIVRPVLQILGLTGTPDQPTRNWPRIWWCPTGPATALALHAAGRHPRTAAQYHAMGEAAAVAESVAGRVISSYTPTLTALIRARRSGAPEPPKQLAVGVPRAPDYDADLPELRQVETELHAVAQYFPPPQRATHLIGPAATRDAVIDALPEHSWLHLSCHASQHPSDPSRSAFLLHDQPLTLADLSALSLRDCDLAYLAACETAMTDIQLPDEGLHLAGALQVVGYRHIVATLWNIADQVTPALADTIYARLTNTGPPDSGPGDPPAAERTAVALHDAVTSLRQAYPDEPRFWAPLIHLGP
jgi:hypothetical protein